MTNEELYRQYLSGDAEAFERLYLQMQGFIASVAKDAAQKQTRRPSKKAKLTVLREEVTAYDERRTVQAVSQRRHGSL